MKWKFECIEWIYRNKNEHHDKQGNIVTAVAMLPPTQRTRTVGGIIGNKTEIKQLGWSLEIDSANI